MWEILKNNRKILGINGRNLKYLRPFNHAKAVALADSKLLTKRMLMKAEIPCAQLFSVIQNRKELESFVWEELNPSFVIKPNRGLGGGGIMVVYGRKKNGAWVGSGNKELTVEDFRAQVNNILDGNFSLANTPDIALIEERLKIATFFKPYSATGVFDIRVIVFNKIPVMAMLRLPTKKSGGKANLAQGGIGVGIDISTGVTTHAITKGWLSEKEIEFIPENKVPLRGVKLPYWQDILQLAVKAQMLSGLGYAGVDITVDKDKGPAILELNARPGLGIQNANEAGLRERLARIFGLKVNTAQRGIKVAQELFGGEVEQEIEEISGKQVLGIIETAKIFIPGKPEVVLQAKIDTGADSTSLDADLALQLGFGEILPLFSAYQKTDLTPEQAEAKLKELQVALKQYNIEGLDAVAIYSGSGTSIRPLIPLEFELAGQKIKTKATVAERKNLTYAMIVGRKDLKRFLVDPGKLS